MNLTKRYFLFIFSLISFNIFAQENVLNYSNFQNVEFPDDSYGVDYTTLASENFELYQYLNTNRTEFSLIMSVDNDFRALNERLNMEYPFKRRRHPLEKTGRILTYIGVPLAIIGGIMVAGADELYYECVNGNCSGDARGGFGVVMLGAGAGLAGTGTVLWIIGSKK